MLKRGSAFLDRYLHLAWSTSALPWRRLRHNVYSVKRKLRYHGSFYHGTKLLTDPEILQAFKKKFYF
jgi:hypothetical protein